MVEFDLRFCEDNGDCVGSINTWNIVTNFIRPIRIYELPCTTELDVQGYNAKHVFLNLF